jgi:hypothetical protein
MLPGETPLKRLIIPIPNKGYREMYVQMNYLSPGNGQEKEGLRPSPWPPGGGLVFVSLIICTISSGLPL